MSYLDRDLDCQQAIETALQELMAKVAAAGWHPDEINEAIEHLAMADRRAREETATVDASLSISQLLGSRS